MLDFGSEFKSGRLRRLVHDFRVDCVGRSVAHVCLGCVDQHLVEGGRFRRFETFFNFLNCLTFEVVF